MNASTQAYTVIRTYYFSVVSSLLLILTIIGFSDNLITDVGQPSNSDPKFVIHGIFCLAWMAVFVVQANLLRTGRYEWHKRLGAFGFMVAVGVTVSTIYIFVVIWERWSAMSPEVRANRFFLPSYSLLILLAWKNTHRPELHKRMICMGSLYMLSPVLGRAAGHLHVHAPAFVIITWNALFISLFVYDWASARKIHRITYLGFGWFYVVWLLAVLT